MQKLIEGDTTMAARYFRALGSKSRFAIYRMLLQKDMNISQIAQALSISQSAATKSVSILEKMGLVQCITRAGIHGAQKICKAQYNEIVFRFNRIEDDQGSYVSTRISIPIGSYYDCHVEPTCGLANTEKMIGIFDDPRTFLEPERITAQLLWFGRGWVEYRFPRKYPRNVALEDITVAMEISSEANWPDGEKARPSDKECPSDISIWINGVKIGPWHSWSFYSDKRGRYNPAWWPRKNNQYGMFKEWRVTRNGAFIDGEKISSVVISDLNLKSKTYNTLRLGVDEQDKNQGGVCLFGKNFGNCPQDILITIRYCR